MPYLSDLIEEQKRVKGTAVSGFLFPFDYVGDCHGSGLQGVSCVEEGGVCVCVDVCCLGVVFSVSVFVCVGGVCVCVDVLSECVLCSL